MSEDVGIGGRVRELRESQKLSRPEMAARLGFSKHQRLADVENGRQRPPTDLLQKIVEIFHVRTEWLMEGKLPILKTESEQTFEDTLDTLRDATDSVANLAISDERKRQVRDIIFGVTSGATELIEQAFRSYPPPASDDLVIVPRYDVKGSAGSGCQVETDRIVEHIAFSQSFIRDILRIQSKYLAIIEVTGNSMEPTLSCGEQVLIDLRLDRFVDDAVYVIQQDGHLRIKRVQIRMDGTVLIKSDSDHYEDEVYSREVAERFHVIGTVLPFKVGRFKL